MKIYNTLTRKKEDFKPIEENKVRMYVCGPTVYNYIHIGNARPMIVFDTVRRYFEYKGYDVNYVSNFTDVDDKIIKKAIEEGTTAKEISERYIKEAKADMAGMNVKEATHHPKATEEIDGMIDMIQTLIEKGHAYAANGTVYFKTRSFAEYGKLSKKNIDDLEAGHREIKVTGEDGKQDALDFVLWKPKKEGEPAWPSPWGEGRPGWHIECSVMSKKYLGDQIDIHAGGEDLIFPHHENEIAQSEACNGKAFSNYWMHNGFVTIGKDNEKMSKSLHNFITVHEIIKEVDPQVLRFFMATTQYRRPIQYSQANLTDAQNNLNHIQTAFDNLTYREQDADEGDVQEVTDRLEQFHHQFITAMDDDINVQNGIATVYELVKYANVYAQQDNVSLGAIQAIKKELVELMSIFGVKLEASDNQINDEKIKQLIEERNIARKNKDFARSDEIRDNLKKQGIILEDTPQGTRYKKE